MLGRFYLTLVLRKVKWGFRPVIKNAGFPLRAPPMAPRLAERYLREAIDLFDRCDADMLLAESRSALDDLPR